MEAAGSENRAPSPSTMALIAASAVLGGACVGGTTNAINGAISPLYFRTIMRWEHTESIWRASVAQGVFEGLLYGCVFAVVYTSVVSLTTGGTCPFRVAFRQILGILIYIYGIWALGGMLAIGLAILSPEFYRETFYGVPDSHSEMLRYAWVGGSIWGALFGGAVTLIFGCIHFRMTWQNSKLNAPALTAENA